MEGSPAKLNFLRESNVKDQCERERKRKTKTKKKKKTKTKTKKTKTKIKKKYMSSFPTLGIKIRGGNDSLNFLMVFHPKSFFKKVHSESLCFLSVGLSFWFVWLEIINTHATYTIIE